MTEEKPKPAICIGTHRAIVKRAIVDCLLCDQPMYVSGSVFANGVEGLPPPNAKHIAIECIADMQQALSGEIAKFTMKIFNGGKVKKNESTRN